MLPNLDCKLFKVKIQEIAWRSMHGGLVLRVSLQALPTAQGSSAAEQKQAPQSNLCFALQSCSEHLCAHIIFNAHPKSIEGKRALQRIHCMIKTWSKAGIVQQAVSDNEYDEEWQRSRRTIVPFYREP